MKKLQRWTIILTAIFVIVFLSQTKVEAVATVVDSADKRPGLQESGDQSVAAVYDRVSDPSSYWILFFGLAGIVFLITREKVRYHLLEQSDGSFGSNFLAKLFLLHRE